MRSTTFIRRQTGSVYIVLAVNLEPPTKRPRISYSYNLDLIFVICRVCVGRIYMFTRRF